jgi:hypothetical protein
MLRSRVLLQLFGSSLILGSLDFRLWKIGRMVISIRTWEVTRLLITHQRQKRAAGKAIKHDVSLFDHPHLARRPGEPNLRVEVRTFSFQPGA